MLDWLSRKLLGPIAGAGDIRRDAEAMAYLPVGALPPSWLDAEPERQPSGAAARRPAAARPDDTEKPRQSCEVILLPVRRHPPAAGRPRTRRRRA